MLGEQPFLVELLLPGKRLPARLQEPLLTGALSRLQDRSKLSALRLEESL